MDDKWIRQFVEECHAHAGGAPQGVTVEESVAQVKQTIAAVGQALMNHRQYALARGQAPQALPIATILSIILAFAGYFIKDSAVLDVLKNIIALISGWLV